MKKTYTYSVVAVALILVGVVLGRLFTFEQQETVSILSGEMELLAPLAPEELTQKVVAMPNGKPVESVDSPVFVVLPAPTSLPLELPEVFVEPVEDMFMPEPVVISQPSIIPQSLTMLVDEVVVPTMTKEEAKAEVKVEEPAPVPASTVQETQTPSVPMAPAGPYVYFYTGAPVQPAPVLVGPSFQFVYASDPIVYTSSFTSLSVVSVPVVQSYVSQVYVPQVSIPQVSVPQNFVSPVFFPQVVPSRVGAPKWVYSNGVVIKPTIYFPHQPVRNVWHVIMP